MHKHLVESRDPRRNRKVTGIMLILLVIGFFIQFMGSLYARSSGVMSDSFHMLVDGTSQLTYWVVLTIAVWGMNTPKWLVKRFPQSPKWLTRVEKTTLRRIGDFASTFLFFVAALISIYLSVHGLAYPQEVHAEVSFGVGMIGLIVNVINLLIILISDSRSNLKGVFLHVKSDLYHSIIVIIGQVIVWQFGQNFRFIDSLLGLWLGAKMIEWGWDYLKELLQGKSFPVKGIIIQFPAYEGHNCSDHNHSDGFKSTCG